MTRPKYKVSYTCCNTQTVHVQRVHRIRKHKLSQLTNKPKFFASVEKPTWFYGYRGESRGGGGKGPWPPQTVGFLCYIDCLM